MENCFVDPVETTDSVLITEIKTILTKSLDRKWIQEEQEYVTNYIQDIITKIDELNSIIKTRDAILNQLVQLDQSFSVQPVSLKEAIFILSKEVSLLKAQYKGDFSNLYNK